MHIRSLGFRTHLRILEMTGSEIEDRGTHLVVRTPANPTFFWGNFLLLRALPVLGGEREVIGAFHTEFPHAAHVAIGLDDAEDQTDGLSPFVEAGLDLDVGVVLTATGLDEPAAPPEGIVIRPLESDDDWERRARLAYLLHGDASEATFMPYARARCARERDLDARGIGRRYGAFADDELVSTAAIYLTHAGVARFRTVETHADHRRQGLAANVIHAAALHAVEHLHVEQLVIAADRDGDAIRLYRRLGFADSEFHLLLERRPETSGDRA